jgi:Zn-dependent protease
LVYADELKRLAVEAESAEKEGDRGRALASWRRVLQLLPAGAGQHQRVMEKVQTLSAALTAQGETVVEPAAGGTTSPKPQRYKWLAGLGAFGALLAKFKWALLFLLGKGKVLLVGLTQAKTFLSMAIALAVYTSVYGWKFALGLVVSIYIHEMGHVVWLRRYGIAASAPMFIPGFGALVRLKQYPANPAEDARVGLAGPIWGCAAAALALGIGVALQSPTMIAIGRIGAWINLFNLIPLWQLDGGRGFAALTQRQRGWAAALLWIFALSGADGVFFLLAIAASVRAMAKGSAPTTEDAVVLRTYALLVVGLWLIMFCAKEYGAAKGIPGVVM